MSRTTDEPGEESGNDGFRFLDLVRALNARSLELLSGWTPATAACDCTLSRLMASHNPWRSLSPSARHHIARLPFVIVDVHFMDASWWQDVRLSMVRDGPPPKLRACVPDRVGASLTQETMMLVWHAVQLDRRAAMWRIGLSRTVAHIIGRLSTQDVLRIAAQFPCEAQPRWGASGDLWHGLISAGESGDAVAWQDARRDALLRLSGELLTARFAVADETLLVREQQ